MDDPRQSVTRKRMERFTSNGQLLSVTDVRTTHFEDQPPHRRIQSNNHPSTQYYSNNRNTISPSREPEYGYATVHTYRTDQPVQFRENYQPSKQSTEDVSDRVHRPLNVRDDYYVPRQVVEREYPIRRVDRVIPQEVVREYHTSGTPSDNWRTTDSYVRKTSILKNGRKQETVFPAGTASSQKVEWREPLDCLIDRMNRIRVSMACQPFQPSVRLADIAAQWAKLLAIRGEFRTDPNRLMNIWMGNRVNDSIADIWWDESEEFGTKNYQDDNDLTWVGVASAFSEHHRQFIVVAVYE